MTDFREEMETKTGLYSPCSSTSLSSVTFRDKCVNQPAYLPLLIETGEQLDQSVYTGRA